ncbi:PGF-pre-PGF domain-containing protein [Candidatus Methanoperedens nitratireducens]|nr:PGF-pre-PGF domain-containing protein [Candidatus Methanoperedens nitroreducens]
MAKAPDRSAANSYNAGGHVYNDQGFALEGVVVKSGSIENITNKDGYYLMAGLSDGTYNFSYSKTGYDTGYLNVRIKGADVVNADKTLYKISPAPQPTQTPLPTSTPQSTSTPQPKSPPERIYIPPVPVSLTSTQGNFWVNHVWKAGTGNVTDSYNVNVNGVWKNGVTSTYFNASAGPHEWSNISVWAYNNSGGGSLSLTSASHNIQVPNNPPIQLPIGDKEVYKGQLLTFKINTSDTDSDTIRYGTSATRGNLDSSTGVYTWTPADGDEGVYIWEFSSSDDYGGKAVESIKVTVRNPLNVELKLIEPGMIDDNGTQVETWRDAKTGHFGKLIGYSSTFKNTGNSSLVVKVTEFYNNKSYDNNSFTVTLAGNETKPCQNRVSGCRLAFEIDHAGVKDGVFNLTLQMNVQVYSGSNFMFNYTNSTTVSLPIIPVHRIKRADGGMVVVTEGGTTRVTYTLEANSTVNLTDVSIYDPFYPGRFFNISGLEANNPRNFSFIYPATPADLSKFKCEEPYNSCIMNIATLTAKTESGNTITDTDYVRLPLCRDTDKDCLGGAAITRQVGTSSSRGGGGGGGMAPSEDIGNIERREVREMDVLSRVSSAYVFRAADPVLVVTFESSASESEVPVSVEILKNRSKNIKDDTPGKLYKYFNVFAGRSGFSKKVSNGVVAFRVNNSWLEENGLDPEDISMYKWQGGWVKKETQIAERKSNYTYYASLTGNFSSFAIVGVKRPEVEIPVSNASAEESIKNTTQTSAYSNISKTEQPGEFLELSAAFVLTGGAMGVVYYLRRNRKIYRKN